MTVGILGYGNFGQFIHMLMKERDPGARVLVWSRNAPADDTTFSSFEAVCSADVVVLTVAISALEEIIPRAFSLLRSDAVLIDVSTVKLHSAHLLETYAQGRKYIATHPMFGPYSYIKKGRTLSGLRIIITNHTLDPEILNVIKMELTSLGLVVLEMSADAHDTVLAETLFLTHYLGQIVTKAGFVRTNIDTISFGFLMDAVESVRNDTKLFQEVYRFNPYCKKTIERLQEAERAVQETL